jgi:hypothetical protein
MENWKKAVLFGSAGVAALLLAKGKRPAGMLAAGIGLVVLASEYPRAFDQIANLTPGPLGRGLRLVEMVSRAGQQLIEENHHDPNLQPDYEA